MGRGVVRRQSHFQADRRRRRERVGRIGIVLVGDAVAEGVGLKKGPGVYSSGTDGAVSVPLDGVEAKLSIPMNTPAELRRKAAKMRGLNEPFFLITCFIGDGLF
jgi:hypothetical protein